MPYLKVSEFLERSDISPFLLGCFFSRSCIKNNTIFTYCSYKSSKFVTNIDDFKESGKEYMESLNKIVLPFKWELKTFSKTSFQACFYLENDLGLDQKRFFNKLYAKLLTDTPWVIDSFENHQKNEFVRGFFESRGSIDTNRPLLSQDYFFNNNPREVTKFRFLIDFCKVPSGVLNLNFRELQNEYYTGTTRRNTQLRINSFWFMKNIGIVSRYKALIFANTHSDISKMYKDGLVFYFNVEEPDLSGFSNINHRLDIYISNILGKNLSIEEIQELRRRLKFDNNRSQSIRDSSLVDLVRSLEPDECVACKNFYNLSDRTHINRTTGKPDLEIHHVISLGHNQELDDFDNLVKICPACHTCLKRGRGTPDEQKRLIAEILKNAPKTLTFAEDFFDETDFDIIVQKIFERLK